MKRWADDEALALKEIKKRLHDELSAHPRHADVVGDRKLLRFYRGHGKDIDKACDHISRFLRWREEAGVAEIRAAILRDGASHPSKFPKADDILRLVPQIVINHRLRDKTGAPLCLEQYRFSPHGVLQEVSVEEYIQFQIYCLEYKSLVLEQLSEEAERKHLEERQRAVAAGTHDPAADHEPYGKILHTCVVRDLSGIGLAHLGREGQEILRAVIGVASDNYPEMMHRCHMINAPWVFNTVWWVIKGWMSARTVDKVTVMGSCFMDELSTHIDPAHIPASIGGDCPAADQAGEPFVFDTAAGGLLWMPEENA